MEGSTILWIIAGAAILLAMLSAVAERRRDKRRNLDKPGWVPWPLLQMLSIMTTVVAAALALLS